jgi:hypothetical protein
LPITRHSPKPTNVVALRKPRSIHDGAPLKQEVSRDQYMGGFTGERVDHTPPLPEPSK